MRIYGDINSGQMVSARAWAEAHSKTCCLLYYFIIMFIELFLVRGWGGLEIVQCMGVCLRQGMGGSTSLPTWRRCLISCVYNVYIYIYIYTHFILESLLFAIL